MICNVNFVGITFAENHDMRVGFQIIVFLIYILKMPIVKLIDIPARYVGHFVFTADSFTGFLCKIGFYRFITVIISKYKYKIKIILTNYYNFL